MKVARLTLLVLVSWGAGGCVTQSAATYDGAFTITVENDTLIGSDNNYTNVLVNAWVSCHRSSYDSHCKAPRRSRQRWVGLELR